MREFKIATAFYVDLYNLENKTLGNFPGNSSTDAIEKIPLFFPPKIMAWVNWLHIFSCSCFARPFELPAEISQILGICRN